MPKKTRVHVRQQIEEGTFETLARHKVFPDHTTKVKTYRIEKRFCALFCLFFLLHFLTMIHANAPNEQ